MRSSVPKGAQCLPGRPGCTWARRPQGTLCDVENGVDFENRGSQEHDGRIWESKEKQWWRQDRKKEGCGAESLGEERAGFISTGATLTWKLITMHKVGCPEDLAS